MNEGKVVVFDAEGAILGRLATAISKALLSGYNVVVVNSEKAVVSGNPHMVIDSYRVWFEIKTLRNPYKWSPKRPRSPVAIVKRAVKGMLPKDNWRGVMLLKNLKVYVGYPEELKKYEAVRVIDAEASRLNRGFITVGEIARMLGWKS
ncbi:MAG: 50S ribosomal protein L13 [Sulfolobales archaeon]|nr:50S ribosomal protein L13 [Sulfolobales archaeon]MCX8186806.1 50S ribosomal protein L13 [Sulfolobales archaeon]MDW7969861.1 50S ribosomal protein L13 [Sulfolobales archaeon]